LPKWLASAEPTKTADCTKNQATNTQEGVEVMMCRLSEHLHKNKKEFNGSPLFFSLHNTGRKACAHYTHSFPFSMVYLSHSVLLIYTEESIPVLFYLSFHKEVDQTSWCSGIQEMSDLNLSQIIG
jgi:hypothetical protein